MEPQDKEFVQADKYGPYIIIGFLLLIGTIFGFLVGRATSLKETDHPILIETTRTATSTQTRYFYAE